MKEWQIHGNHSSAGNLPAISKQEISDLLPKTIVACQTPVFIGFLAEHPLAFIQIVIRQVDHHRGILARLSSRNYILKETNRLGVSEPTGQGPVRRDDFQAGPRERDQWRATCHCQGVFPVVVYGRERVTRSGRSPSRPCRQRS